MLLLLLVAWVLVLVIILELLLLLLLLLVGKVVVGEMHLQQLLTQASWLAAAAQASAD